MRALDFPRAAVSGVLLALSFPSIGHPLLAWIALAPLLIALSGVSLTRAFLLGLTTGIIYFAGTLYWITHVMVVYAELPPIVAPIVGVLVNAALIAYLALFPALFAVVVRRVTARFGPAALMTAPLVWVATELGRTYLLTGFPWVLLGYSQASVLPIAQFASIFGVYGVSALVVLVNAAIARLGVGSGEFNPAEAGSPVREAGRAGGSGFSRILPLVASVILVALIAVWGGSRVSRAELTSARSDSIRVGLIQGNVDQAEKWDTARSSEIFNGYLQMTERAIAEGAELVLWPEASMPFMFEEAPVGAERVREIARHSGVPIVIGSDQVERNDHDSFKLYNAAFLVNPDGSTGAVYRKMHLVPFGEYVPLQNLLFFAKRLVVAVSDFSAGSAPTLMPVRGHPLSTAICYEIVYPELVRGSVLAGSELLSTITNDAWFGATSAPYQHFSQAAMRAIENGRYLVRAANTGISGVVDPYGRVLAESRIYEPAVIVRDVRFLRDSTFYTRYGDVFAYASTIVSLAMLILARRRVQYAHGHR